MAKGCQQGQKSELAHINYSCIFLAECVCCETSGRLLKVMDDSQIQNIKAPTTPGESISSFGGM